VRTQFYFLVLILISQAQHLKAASNASSNSTAYEINTQKIRSHFIETKNKVIEVELQERKILSSLYDINTQMKTMSKKRDQLTNKVFAANSQVKDVAREIALLEEKIKTQKVVLGKKLKVIYKLKTSGALPVIFSSSNSHELDRVLKYLKLYSETDFIAIQDYQKDIIKLEKNRKRLKREVLNLVSVKDELKEQEKALEKQQVAKAKILSKVEKKKLNQIRRLDQFMEKTKEFVQNNQGFSVNDLLDNSFFSVKGKIPFPVKGDIVKEYGIIEDPTYKYKLSHKGIFFTAKQSSSVLSVHGGKVEFVGSVAGYGKTVIVDHGDHYYSVYSHLADVKVKSGQVLEKGQKIANVGDTSERFGVGIYFELRHFSEAIDPQSWLVAATVETSRSQHE
jgi:septal ring factor EnvC (AmiA/AmiB activator)